MANPIKKNKPPTPSKPVPAPASTKKVRKAPVPLKEKGKPVKKTRPPTRPKPAPAPPSTQKARTAPVRFTEKQVLAADLKPPLGHDEGTYKRPGLVIENGSEPPLPKSVQCTGSLVIYSSSAMYMDDCTGFSGPKDGDNSMVARARKNAEDAAGKIPCAEGCVKHVVEIWHGWDCTLDPNLQPPANKVAMAAVELEIVCRIES